MKRAIILAGGKGTRLKPYTISLPKPLVPLGTKPILEHIIEQLKFHGFTHVTITLNHMAEIIKAYFGDGSKWGLFIDYTFENKALSTMGPLKLVHDLPANFLVMNGDVLTNLNLLNFFNFHVESNSLFTISSHRRKEVIDYGLLHVNDNSRLVKFQEKPNYEFLVSMGVYMVDKLILDSIPDDTFYGFDHLMHKLIEDDNFALVYEHQGFWLDIGRPSDYELATLKIEDPNFTIL